MQVSYPAMPFGTLGEVYPVYPGRGGSDNEGKDDIAERLQNLPMKPEGFLEYLIRMVAHQFRITRPVPDILMAMAKPTNLLQTAILEP
jgi:hypothetical protein